ncbi:MAG: hypothetical protein M1833_000664 [Piccolia ochrophora]|nr:MAG: hypothetical protein M1833_000664 [Piccolia ochrophora]
MGRLPAVVMVVRHGARLDAADSQWHLTSPTPYDTPLTYGGWTQSRALGARIASLLHARESSEKDLETIVGDVAASDAGHDTNGDEAGAGVHKVHERHRHVRNKHRKHKVIIHTSPFVRCVQTAIALCAGMAQYQGTNQGGAPKPSSKKSANRRPSSPTLSASGNSPNIAALPDPEDDPSALLRQKYAKQQKPTNKPLLRIDAFLGEWLNPDYFDLITPPPSSVMMVAGAKADLLRRGDYGEAAYSSSGKSSHAFPGGWGSAVVDSEAEKDRPPSTTSPSAQSQPRIQRASSHGVIGSQGKLNAAKGQTLSSAQAEDGGYTPPTPTYAISASDPIPSGYVAHARDACLEVDYRWDSMREPQDWGSGGEYGEEWGVMHKRIRRALQQMLTWYRDHDLGEGHRKRRGSTPEPHVNEADDDLDTDTVLILVSHGAGCNAIIGGLTDSPVLLDVGMASLTMAVRKPVPNGQSEAHGGDDHEHPRYVRRRTSVSIPISEDYDVKLTASTEHLRAGSNPLVIPQLQTSRAATSLMSSSHRHRHGSPVEGPFSIGEPYNYTRTSSMSSAIGSIRRAPLSSNAVGPARAATGSPTGLTGLWSPRVHPIADDSNSNTEEDSPGDDMVLNFSHSDETRAEQQQQQQQQKQLQPQPQPQPIPRSRNERTEKDTIAPLSTSLGRVNSQRGLWSSRVMVVDEAQERDRGPKRRWTVNEHHT